MDWWIFGKSRQLRTIESLLKKAVHNQEGIAKMLEDLKDAVSAIAADAMSMGEEVKVALDHIVKVVNPEDNPEIANAVASLRDSHEKFTATFKELKDKVDSVLASGGPAA